jgi:hypothetical protein
MLDSHYSENMRNDCVDTDTLAKNWVQPSTFRPSYERSGSWDCPYLKTYGH